MGTTNLIGEQFTFFVLHFIFANTLVIRQRDVRRITNHVTDLVTGIAQYNNTVIHAVLAVIVDTDVKQ